MKQGAGPYIGRRTLLKACAASAILPASQVRAEDGLCQDHLTSGSFEIRATYTERNENQTGHLRFSSDEFKLDLTYAVVSREIRRCAIFFDRDTVVGRRVNDFAARLHEAGEGTEHTRTVEVLLAVDDRRIRIFTTEYEYALRRLLFLARKDVVPFIQALMDGRSLEVTLNLAPFSGEPIRIAQHTIAIDDFRHALAEATQRINDLRRDAMAERCTPISPRGDGCFLTTACCDALGRPDDGFELVVLRRFRDNWLARQPGGAEEISEYRRIAPDICAAIADDPIGRLELIRIYIGTILPCVTLIGLGFQRAAWALYRRMVWRLRLRYGLKDWVNA